MNKKSTHLVLYSFFALVLVLFFLDLTLGSVVIPIKDSIEILMGDGLNKSWTFIILDMRLPRAITAVLTGSGLAISGLMMQTLFRNPLAGPYILGISSGASLGVSVFVMATTFLSQFLSININFLGSWGMVLSAITGAMLIFMLVMLVATKVRDSVSLLIVGIMFGSLTSAIVSVLQYFSRPELVQKFVIWTMGSLSSTGWKELSVLTPCVILGTLLSVFLIKPMNALLLGENNARLTGININSVRFQILLATGILAGSLTAFNGPIAFIGLAVPHLVRMVFNSTNNRILFPGALIFGAGLLLICDIISQVPGKSIVLPINSITALFGAPVVFWIILGRKKFRASF
jgi:iron complex transport system permease protein